MQRDLAGLRLLLIGNWPPPAGGVSIHVQSLRDAAVRRGATVTVLDIGQRRHDEPGVVGAAREALFAPQLARLVRAHDIVHLHTSGANPKSWALAAAVGACAGTLRRQAVVTLHSGHGPHWIVTAPRALAARAVLAAFDRVVAVSDEIAHTLTRIGVPIARVEVIPAFGLEGLSPIDPAGRLAGVRGRPLVSAMLAPGADYGRDELLAAHALFRRTHPDATLVVYGPGTEDVRGERVVALGELGRAEALGVQLASDVFVRPTRVDGDSVSVREAVALGVRVVATAVGTRPAGVHLVAPRDPAALAEGLVAALENPPPPAVADDGVARVLDLHAGLRRASAA